MLVRDTRFSDSIKYWIKPDLENRVAAGEIKAHFGTNVRSIETNVVRYTDSENVERTVEADAVLALTGYRPDYRFLERLQIDIADDPARTPVLDDETFETTRKGVFLAGTVCGGLNTSRWFIENGRHHAAQIAKAISGTR
jgi:thioredoxin reductase (NADPH)